MEGQAIRDAPAARGGVHLGSILQSLRIVLATVACLGLLVGGAFSGPRVHQQQAVPQKATTGFDVEALVQKAEQGDATAQFKLGNAYRLGEGVPQD
jgi:TPR repeat protein